MCSDGIDDTIRVIKSFDVNVQVWAVWITILILSKDINVNEELEIMGDDFHVRSKTSSEMDKGNTLLCKASKSNI
jgi:hypothetical protein